MKKYDVIVVGGGIAGLTAFAYLKEYGERALLLEKERETGGLVDCFEAYGSVLMRASGLLKTPGSSGRC